MKTNRICQSRFATNDVMGYYYISLPAGERTGRVSKPPPTTETHMNLNCQPKATHTPAPPTRTI